MKKVKSLIAFVGKARTTKGRITLILVILFSLLEFPAFVFHEIMHLLVAIPFGHNIKVLDSYFFLVQDSPVPGRYTLKSYSLAIQYESSPFIGILGSAAPLIGWIIAVTALALTGHLFILLYFLLGIRMFFLSEQDIESIRLHGVNSKICDFLLEIQKGLKQNINVNVE